MSAPTDVSGYLRVVMNTCQGCAGFAKGHSMTYATLTAENALRVSKRYISTIPAFPGGFRGQGIVIAAGGCRYFANAWVCLKMLRHLGCRLPIQLWHLGDEEVDDCLRLLVRPLGVEWINALEFQEAHATRMLGGHELKPYAVL